MTSLSGKTVLVSGVGPGLGRELAATALREGANVVIGARTEERLKVTASELDPSGERVAYAALDVRDAAGCARLVDTATSRFGGLDAVVHCAAYDASFGGIEGAMDLEEFRAVYDINVFGTLQLTQAALPALKVGGGAVVFIGTQSMYLPRLMQLAYGLVQGQYGHGLPSHGRGARPLQDPGQHGRGHLDVGPRGRGLRQRRGGRAGRARRRGESLERSPPNMPLQEIPEDGDVAEAVMFLASDRGRMITGQTLFVNAGEFLPLNQRCLLPDVARSRPSEAWLGPIGARSMALGPRRDRATSPGWSWWKVHPPCCATRPPVALSRPPTTSPGNAATWRPLRRHRRCRSPASSRSVTTSR